MLGIAFAGSGCRHPASPDEIFAQIRDEMRLGQLDVALQRADAASAKYATRDPQWAARFRVQKAHILMMRAASIRFRV